MPNVMSNENSVEIIFLGKNRDFATVWELQKKIHKEVSIGNENDKILFLEHSPVFTLGFHGNENNLLIDCNKLTDLGIKFYKIDRGGDITYHCPGQMVAYFIINLRKRGYGVKEFVRRLETAVINVCSEFGIKGFIREDAPGVWIENGKGEKKICAIGLRVSHGVTMHGIALNINNDITPFGLINPCGFKSNQVTSMQLEMGEDKPLDLKNIYKLLSKELRGIL